MSKKVLVVCGQEIIKERNDGGKLCSYRNWELFCKVFGQENVYLMMFSVYDNDASENQTVRLPYHKNKISKAWNVFNGHMFTSAANERQVLEFIQNNNIDTVIFERSMFGSLIRKIKKNTTCSIWIFIHNIERQYFKNKLKHSGLLYLIPYLTVSKSERLSLKYADYIMTLTERDSKLLHDIYRVQGNIVLPMTFKDQFDPKRKYTKNKEKELLFIGTMFPPNYDGVKWFVENVMPELKDYTLKIVGKNFEKRKELERDNVQVIGTVDDLTPYYYSASAMVMPIFYGDGMKIKTAESMMFGRTIFASDEALEGYEVEGVEGIYRCNTKEEYIRNIREFYEKKELPVFYKESVRQTFLDKYSFESQAEKCREAWIY